MSAGRIDFNRVAMFVQIASAGGVTAAATQLKIPKSSVSRGLTQLEAELGVELVVRTSRQFRLTAAGTAFYRAASKGISTVDDAREAIHREKATPHGLIRIAAPANFGTVILPPVLTKFVRRYPKVRLELCVTGKAVDPLRDGFDLVVSTGKLPDSSSKVRTFKTTLDSGVYASSEYLREFGRPQRPNELTRHECILRSPSTARKDRWRLLGPKGPVVVPVDGHIRVDDLMSAVAAVTADGGLAVLPLKLSEMPNMKAIERVLPDYIVRGEAVQLVYPAQRHVPLQVTLLCDAILAHARESCVNHDTAAAAQ